MTAKRQKSVTILKWVNLSVLFVALIFPLFLCLSVAFNDGRRPTWLHFLPIPTALLVLGVAVLITRGIFLLVDREHQEWQDFIAEFKFIVLLSGTGWSLGAGVASLMAALYFTLPDARPHERFDVGFGLYFSIIGLTLAIHAFYRQYAPITNFDFFLLRLIDDLRGKDNPHRLYVVFPALNLGFYRFRKAVGDRANRPSNDLFWRFARALRDNAHLCKREQVRLATYPLADYIKLYLAYARMASDDPRSPERGIAYDAAQNAMILISDITGPNFQYAGLKEFEPPELPQHCIIIDDIIYTIATFHMPIYNPQENDFTPVRQPAEGGKLADLYVYRRQDRAFADTIARHLDELFRLRGNELTPQHLSHWLNCVDVQHTRAQNEVQS